MDIKPIRSSEVEAKPKQEARPRAEEVKKQEEPKVEEAKTGDNESGEKINLRV